MGVTGSRGGVASSWLRLLITAGFDKSKKARRTCHGFCLQRMLYRCSGEQVKVRKGRPKSSSTSVVGCKAMKLMFKVIHHRSLDKWLRV